MNDIRERLEAAGFNVVDGKIDCGPLGHGEIVDVRGITPPSTDDVGSSDAVAPAKHSVRVLVFGGRDYAEVRKWGSERSRRTEQEAIADRQKARLWQILDAAVERLGLTEIVEGGATGADRQARYWAKERGIPWITEIAKWDEHGNAAGPIRNAEMLEKYKPDIAIGFPGGAGTKDMASKVEAAGIRLIKVDWK